MRPVQIAWVLTNGKLRSFEKATICYLALTGLLSLLCYNSVADWQGLIAIHLILIAGIALIQLIPEGAFPGFKTFREFYIVLLFPVLFEEMTNLVPALFPYYLEPALIASEKFLLEMHQLYFPDWQPTFWLTELMAFGYSAYYIIIPMAALVLYARGSRSLLENFWWRFSLTMFICYTLFILIPVRGPHHSVLEADPAALSGGLFFHFVLWLQNQVSVVGAAFPSSHVAATWIAAFSLRGIDRRLYYYILPVVILLTVSVFYLRYHYVLDAVFGYLLAEALERFFFSRKPITISEFSV